MTPGNRGKWWSCAAFSTDSLKPGDVVVIRYEGPKGGPGMQEMLYPTSYLKSKGLGKACALVTDGRFSGGTAGLSIGHASPEAAEGGAIGLLRNGDIIEIDIPNRRINAALSEAELATRRAEMESRETMAEGTVGWGAWEAVYGVARAARVQQRARRAGAVQERRA